MAEEQIRRRSDRYKDEIEVEDVEETKEIKVIKKEPKKVPEQKEQKTKEQHPLLNKIILTIIITIIILISYSTMIEPKFINIKEYKIESKLIPDSFHGTKIVQFSDIHYGTTINKKQLERIANKINELKPDIIVFTGDLLDKNISLTQNTEEELTTYLSSLKCSLYKYAIFGDEDLDNKKYQEIMTKSGFTILDNKSIPLYYKDTTPILIAGYNPIITKPNYTILTDFIDNQDPTNYFKLVLTHEPDSIDKFINYNPNLVLSGHSLGGSIDLKFTKPLMLPTNSTKYFEDYQKIKNTDLYISNGLGTTGLNARFLNPPSINLYRLYKTK
ncbi:MAG: metallophosphoesterase [Bacilli bacterium]|nr:metallophosphoesterase [Bacilli bacterium]